MPCTTAWQPGRKPEHVQAQFGSKLALTNFWPGVVGVEKAKNDEWNTTIFNDNNPRAATGSPPALPGLLPGSHLTPHSSTHTLSFDWAYPVGLMGGCLWLFMPTSQSVSRRIGWLRYCLEYLIVVVNIAGSQAQNISFYDIDRSRCLYWQLNNGPTAINHGAGQVLVGSCRACCLLPPQPSGNTYKRIASTPQCTQRYQKGGRTPITIDCRINMRMWAASHCLLRFYVY